MRLKGNFDISLIDLSFLSSQGWSLLEFIALSITVHVGGLGSFLLFLVLHGAKDGINVPLGPTPTRAAGEAYMERDKRMRRHLHREVGVVASWIPKTKDMRFFSSTPFKQPFFPFSFYLQI